MLKVLLRGHPRLIATVFRHRIRNLDGVREAAFFCLQWIGGLEFRDVAPPIGWLDLVRGAVFSFPLDRLPKPLPRCLAVRQTDLPKYCEQAPEHEQSCNLIHGHSTLEVEVLQVCLAIVCFSWSPSSTLALRLRLPRITQAD